MPTIRDVAKHAGVSIATVSRVINESGFVSEELRSVVLKAMQDLHFQPSALAKGLNIVDGKIVYKAVADVFDQAESNIRDVVGAHLQLKISSHTANGIYLRHNAPFCPAAFLSI